MENFAAIAIGIVCILLGISHRKGNLSALHSYHRNRVSEEDRLPFGKLVGLGTIIIGVALALSGAFPLIVSGLQESVYTLVRNVLIISGLVIGGGIAFYAMKKYNNGIF